MLLGYTAARACAGSRSLIQFTRLFFLVRGWSLGTLSWGTFYDWTPSLCQSFLSIVRKNQKKYKSIITDLPFTSCALVSREREPKSAQTKKCTRRWKTNTSQVTSIKEKITISNHKVMLTAESKVGERDGPLGKNECFDEELLKKLSNDVKWNTCAGWEWWGRGLDLHQFNRRPHNKPLLGVSHI